MLHAISEGDGENEEARDAGAMSGDEDLLMERGNDLALNTVCPLSMKEVRRAYFVQLLAGCIAFNCPFYIIPALTNIIQLFVSRRSLTLREGWSQQMPSE